MKRICIVGAMNIRHMSLISLYTKFFDDNEISYDLIYMDRYGIEEKSSAQNKYCLRVTMDRSWHKLRKLMVYLKFRRFAKRVLLKEKYDIVITWQTFTAYLLADILLTKLKGKYVVNVRDYIAENFPPVKWLLKLLVKHAAFTTISSKGFFEFLPKGEYIKVNSINEEVVSMIPQKPPLKNKDIIRIGFVGNCRFFNENKLFIDALRNDPRFELWYCGSNSDIFQKYAEENQIINLHTMPAFEPSETASIAMKFDMINSIYGNNGIDNRTLIPIRLYTAVAYGLPVLASSGTQLAEEIAAFGLGYVVDEYENIGDSLYEYMHTLDRNSFRKNCETYLHNARRENMKFIGKLRSLVGCER